MIDGAICSDVTAGMVGGFVDTVIKRLLDIILAMPWMALALAAEPSLIVADEPTSALDVSTAAGILRLLVGAAEKGASIIIASHDHTLLNALCHRALSMREGRLGE